MDSVDLLNKYKELNESYKPILVYHVGIDAGFFSEFNDLIFMILYCLEHKIQFKLYSDDANFGIEKGWQDYFEPFCEEVHEQAPSLCFMEEDRKCGFLQNELLIIAMAIKVRFTHRCIKVYPVFPRRKIF